VTARHTAASLTADLSKLGVEPGGVLLVHTSFKAVGPVEGGPLALIDALRSVLGPLGTLVMPTMTAGDSVFDPTTTPTVDMGITAELFWRQPGVLRSTHPGGSFAARGPQAAFICQPQRLSPPHGADSPVGRVYELAGQILLLGVTHGENTTLHLAEAIASVPYSVSHPCVVVVDGEARSVPIAETDHCCENFRHADAWLRGAGQQREGHVGNAHARLCNARDIVATAVEHLLENPLVFLCPRERGCEECELAHRSIRA
jgi:aminoglycoside 3-N-acetyltransferase